MMRIHDAAADGYGAGAATYREARSASPQESIDRFVDSYGSGPVVDPGAGAGTFTAQLLGRGVDVTAIEPVASMRAEFADTIDADVLDGTASSMPLADGFAATVVAAQAFHWFDAVPSPDDIARALAPVGHLVTDWTVRDEEVPWVAAPTNVKERYAGDTPRHRRMRWRRAIDADDRYELLDGWRADHAVPTDADGVVARARSAGCIAVLDLDEQAVIERDVPHITWELAPAFEYPYRAELQAWRRR